MKWIQIHSSTNPCSNKMEGEMGGQCFHWAAKPMLCGGAFWVLHQQVLPPPPSDKEQVTLCVFSFPILLGKHSCMIDLQLFCSSN